MTFLADVVYLLGAALYLPILVYQMIVQGKNRRGWAQRFGRIPHFGPGPRVWLHAVSLGEVNATPKLVAALKQRLPGVDIVVSTTTDTGYARACTLYDPAKVFRFPLDFSWVVSRVLENVQPSLIVLVELEVWYNLTALAAKRNIPVVVANGRLTERSCRRFALLGPIGRSMFRRLAWVGAQDETIAERFRRVGVPGDRVEITGSVKWDTAQVADHIDGAADLAAAMGMAPDRPLWVCGSTGVGEEVIILDAYRRILAADPRVVLAIIPRKPERFDEVAALIERAGFRCLRRSGNLSAISGQGPLPDGRGSSQTSVLSPPSSALSTQHSALSTQDLVFLGDTMGELRKFYSLATVVFVGRSLVRQGGSDPMEVAALAKPVLVGPHTDNFAVPVACLEAAGAVRIVRTASDLADEVARICSDGDEARRLGQAARQVVLANQGATMRTANALVRFVQTA